MHKLGLKILQKINPEDAHNIALWGLKNGLVKPPVTRPHVSLQQTLWGQLYVSPVGIAAGFDKNAQVYERLGAFGFGFIEVGAITPRPQPGNPKPRLFRLSSDQAIINRFGFNNDGMAAITGRLKQAKAIKQPIWANIGANKDTVDRIDDYRQVLTAVCPHVDGVTLNVSSPNTQNLRSLQAGEALHALVKACRDELNTHPESRIPLLVKIAPDLTDDDLKAIIEAVDGLIDGLIATNTTIQRDGLNSQYQGESGGLSGRPLFVRSTQILRQLYTLTDGKLPLIGVGGVENTQTAYAKIRAGASLVQLYTGLVYKGLELCSEINVGLADQLDKDGFDTIAQAVGADHHSTVV